MSDTTSRALGLLSLLQVHRHWPGAELADRLGVTERTVRRDVERLRRLGYRIESTPGAAGGYRLRAGSAVPPLLLTDEEAVAMAIGLRLAATQRLVGGPETTLAALAKLEQVLPRPLRERVNALAGTVRPTGVGTGTGASPAVLGELALACRDRERVRFAYTPADEVVSQRLVEPHYLVPSDRHWYLLCWDLDRADWRTFRVDRLSGVQLTRTRFEPRPMTPEEVEERVFAGTSWGHHAVEGAVVMELPLAEMQARFGVWGQGAEAVDEHRTRWPMGGNDVREAMYALAWVPEGVAYTVELGGPERAQLAEIVTRMAAALSAEPAAAPRR